MRTDVRSGMGSHPRQHAPYGPSVHRAPFVFVALAPAQKVKLAATLADGRLDGVRDEQGARALVGELRIEASEPGVGPASVAQAVVGACAPPAEAHQEESRQAGCRQPRRRRREELLDALAAKGFAPALRLPAGAMQPRQLAQEIADAFDSNALDGEAAAAVRTMTRHPQLAQLAGGNGVAEAIDG